MNRRELVESRGQARRLDKFLASAPDLTVSLGDGWTVSSALAHLAFWDRRAALLMEGWMERGDRTDSFDDDLLNAGLLPEWKALQPEVAATLAVEAFKDVDVLMEKLPDAVAAEIVAEGEGWLLDRAATGVSTSTRLRLYWGDSGCRAG